MSDLDNEEIEKIKFERDYYKLRFEELEATKNLQEKTADEMFEELGYKKQVHKLKLKYFAILKQL